MKITDLCSPKNRGMHVGTLHVRTLLPLSHTGFATDGSQVRHLSAKGSLTPVGAKAVYSGGT